MECLSSQPTSSSSTGVCTGQCLPGSTALPKVLQLGISDQNEQHSLEMKCAANGCTTKKHVSIFCVGDIVGSSILKFEDAANQLG